MDLDLGIVAAGAEDFPEADLAAVVAAGFKPNPTDRKVGFSLKYRNDPIHLEA